SDRKILMSTGDAQNTSLSQNMNSLAGKILRINLDGSIPSDNPDPTKWIWSIGHRNPQGLVEAPNGKVYSSEHGPSNDDEVNIIIKGGHYGWPDVQGFCNLPQEMTFCNANNVTEPIYAWTPTLAVAGLDYYDASGEVITQTNTYLNNQYGRLRDVCVSPNGDIYVSTSNRDGRNNNPDPTDDRILKLENLAFISLPEPDISTTLSLHPNPVTDVLHIRSKQTGELRIINSNGQLIKRYVFANTIDVSDLPVGVYVVEIFSDSGTSRQKFVKR
ncbi:MAG: PQQ-dependent sugar dehydrogenase, partial [Owenweeksia sp.]